VQLSTFERNRPGEFAIPKSFGARVHTTQHRKGGSGVPPLYLHRQEAGRLFHFEGKKMGAKTYEQEIPAPEFFRPPFCLPVVVFNFHAAIMGYPETDKKPTGGF
jgi:hypothetical protein